MSTELILDYTVKAATLILLLSLLPICVATLIGLLVSLFQALTQIQEQTLSFAVKLIAVAVTLLLAANWLGAEMYNYTISIFEAIPIAGQ